VNDSGDRLARSRRELAASRHLATGGFPVQAISRAYYAAFYAAELALAELGETRSRHSGVVAAFGQLLVRAGTLDPAAGRLLRSLFERRARADYGARPSGTSGRGRRSHRSGSIPAR
jgi:uncharacterized protein (UPF0332 family)